ncbi:MAG: hypothetical protein WA875_06030 [Candidatus Acidiferrales bacterium]
MADNKCPDCKLGLMTVQVAMHFNATGTGSNEWPEFPVLAGICPKCGRMDFALATPVQFKEWLDSEMAKSRAARAGL